MFALAAVFPEVNGIGMLLERSLWMILAEGGSQRVNNWHGAKALQVELTLVNPASARAKTQTVILIYETNKAVIIWLNGGLCAGWQLMTNVWGVNTLRWNKRKSMFSAPLFLTFDSGAPVSGHCLHFLL